MTTSRPAPAPLWKRVEGVVFVTIGLVGLGFILTGGGTLAERGSFVFIALAAVLFMWAERAKPYNPEQGLFRTGFWTDFVGYCLVQSFVLGVVIGRIVGWLDVNTGWSQYKLVSDWPIAAQVAFFILTHDLYIYWFHRWQHRSPTLWRLHEAHHSVPQVDWLSGVRSHSLEILVNQTIEYAPMILLGASPEVPVIKGAISAVWGMWIHSNLDVRMGKLQYVINGPEMHRWHHADDPEAYDTNFSTKFAFWDWMFGTAYFPDPAAKKAQAYGLGYPGWPEGSPMAYVEQHIQAFKAPLRPDLQPGRGGHVDSEAAAPEAPAADLQGSSAR
ncbi:MAG: sterol desaturase family protein [Gemmatimonadales bacterium]|nr:sterol desaturase family protein [Gemmatimonadales bacterium]